MGSDRFEFAAIYLVVGMAFGLMGGGLVFPQIGTMLGDTYAGIVLAATGTLLAGIVHELVSGLVKPR